MHWRGANRSRGSPRVKRDSDRSYSSLPFPEIPEGVIITPFKDFEAHGFRRSLDSDGIERDMLGIPTIALRFKHRDDVSKTNPNPGMRTPSAPKQFSKEWWIDWEEVEHLRIQGPYDHTVPAADLLRQGARDFQKYRDFPPGVFKTLWEVFKIYAGIMGTTPVWQRESDAEVDDDDDLSDYDNKPFRPLRPREPYELYEVKPPIVKDDAEIQALLLAARTTRDTRAERFLASPAAAIQVFLSSYMADQNLILSDRNLVNAPHLLHFFVKFLLRNKVLPDKYDDELNRALDTIEVAKRELPVTSKISKSLPDAFAAACQNRWGSSVADYTSGVDPALSAFETSLRAENIETISTETLDTEGDNSAGCWNTPAPSATDWNVSGAGPQTLSALLGPTTLSLAHGPGVVERSVRRIFSIDTPLSSDVTTGQLHRVEMGPWAGWDADGSEDAVPAILKSDLEKRHSVENNIRFLVEPAAAENLCVGMGLGGIWVQLRLSSDDAAADRVWYLEKLTRVLPSYWIART